MLAAGLFTGPAAGENTGENRVFGTLESGNSAVLSGAGSAASTAARLLLTAGFEIDSRTLFDQPGGRLHVSAMHQTGDNGTRLVGDFQGFSNIDAAGFTAITEAWYQHHLLDGRLRLKFGKVDANSEFAYVEHGGGFLQSSPGFSPTILGFPSYPDPATSVNLFYHGKSGAYAGVGVYDGATQAGVATGTRGPSTFFGTPDGLFSVVETGVHHRVTGRPGRVGIGAWRHGGDFDRFGGGRQSSTQGIYLVLDQSLVTGPAGRTRLGLFAQYGYADADVSPVQHHAGAGLQWYGPLTDRPDDSAGLMASFVQFSKAPGAGFTDRGELAVECFYRWQAADWLALQPDLQFIDNPGGRGRPDALIMTLRAAISL
ncbi:carbohydrate porin [Spectribacter hydrogenooxidans]|uniref:Carbohydrate porin n=1 Tax=Spectribacter hydrogenoxidans TaxID=3075608 RepID=A0ABU3BW58_9GAMM|nr:carbohydrate porin [Salinisphaera sp. W335]MDT0633514.1 carbohydrate porin [Salinisphaera sp. W335]